MFNSSCLGVLPLRELPNVPNVIIAKCDFKQFCLERQKKQGIVLHIYVGRHLRNSVFRIELSVLIRDGGDGHYLC